MTDLYAILGWPLGHTLSPRMHNAAFKAKNIDAHYIAVALEPVTVRRKLKGLKKSGIRGFNVTVPYKETVLPFLDRISPEARLTGAVNTIEAHNGRWSGHNTDIHGFRQCLREGGVRVRGRRALVLGAGGAAKAAVAALIGEARLIGVHNRTASRASRLIRGFGVRNGRKLVRVADPLRDRWDVVVNCTSLGLKRTDPSPVPRAVFRHAAAAVDMIYNPPETRFLRDARRAGCQTVGGIGMLIHQGARAWELWTGKRAPVQVMRRAVAGRK